MLRLFTSTRGISSWRERLSDPEKHWKRRYSAFEAAVSWELAARSECGLPTEIGNILSEAGYLSPSLLQAIPEHKVDLPGGNAASQSDVWALIDTAQGRLSLTVEAKANETFGAKSLGAWLVEPPEDKRSGREARWEYVRKHLPGQKPDQYRGVRYQLLHRCAAAVIEAQRWKLAHACFIVQAFCAPDESYAEFELFCGALNCPTEKHRLATTRVGDVTLSVGWVDSQFATDEQIAAVV